MGVASSRANIVQVVGEVAGVAAVAVGDTTSQEVSDIYKLDSPRNHIFWLQSSLDLWYILGVGGTFKLVAGDRC